MNRAAPPRPSVRPEPLREFGQGPIYLFFYVSFLIATKMLLVGWEKKTVIAC